ncbi:MAG: hypothetical protein KDB61_10310 [Planctomycetes bacterium]|nr:hypothetical protein [Planctomycetota bacterium]
MNIPTPLSVASLIATFLLVSCAGGDADAAGLDPVVDGGAPVQSATETIAAMVADCEASADARAQRHSAKPLY